PGYKPGEILRDPLTLSTIHLVLLLCSSRFWLPGSLCLWVIPLIRLIMQNVGSGLDWLKRRQARACWGGGVMMSNGV
ncbi:hypothetical protein GOODEAATRI_014088, partial [Goodea atripinnis]